MVSNSGHKCVRWERPVRNQRQGVCEPKTAQEWQLRLKGLSKVAKEESKGNGKDDVWEAGIFGEAWPGLGNHSLVGLPDVANENASGPDKFEFKIND